MPVNRNETTGESVYISPSREEHEERVQKPFYETARELIRRNVSKESSIIIDVGCSDLVATGPLIEEGFKVVGLDLDETAVDKAKEFYPNANVFVADIRAIPLSIPEEHQKF